MWPRGLLERARLWTALALCAGCARPVVTAHADLLLRGGRIYTVDSGRTVADALAVREGRIAAIGTEAELERWVGPGTEVVELAGRLVLPGFHDAHAHPLHGGIAAIGCDLSGLVSVEAILEKVQSCGELSESPWILGSGWDLSLFPDANADRRLLDRVAADRPVFLQGADGHSAWVNTRALELAGVTRETRAPPQGVIERDHAGDPSGTLRESAIALVRERIPAPDLETRLRGLRHGLRIANGFGITSFVDAALGRADLEIYRSLAESGELQARTVLCMELASGQEAELEALIHERERYRSPRTRPDCVKIFVDGVLEGETAALLDPYLDRPSHRGRLDHEPAALADAVARYDRMGLQVHMHAIGDRAVRVALDAVAEARRRNGRSDGRHQLAHLQLVATEDQPRFAALEVAADFQALWAFPDGYITLVNLPAVGRERVERMYPIGSLRRAGARIVAGSDWPVSSMNPLEAIQVALTRRDPSGRAPDALNPAERVDLPTMIAAYTIEGAWIMHQERETGSLEVGKLADLVILERDLFAIPEREIGAVQVTRTLLQGETVFAR